MKAAERPSVGSDLELVARVDARGRCEELIRDSGNVAARLRAGTSLTAIVHPDSVSKTFRFLQALREEGATFNWELQIAQGDRTTPLHFAGHRTAEGAFLIVASASRHRLVRLYEAVAVTGSQMPRADAAAGGSSSAAARDAIGFDEYDEVARVNNELVNLQRELARKNAHLERIVSALEAGVKKKDLLLARVAHDLRGPLSPIVTWTALLRGGTLGPADLPRAAEALERGTRGLVALVDDLLDFARLTTGKLRVTLRPIDLREALRDAIDQMAAMASAKGVSIATTIPEHPIRVAGDMHRLTQVFWNLLSNAVKATPPDGRVEVAVALAGDAVAVRVIDHGSGIRPSLLPHVFEPFRQDADGISDGLGLGLTVAHDIVDRHGGSVTVASAGQDRGAVFTVTLPLCEENVVAV